MSLQFLVLSEGQTFEKPSRLKQKSPGDLSCPLSKLGPAFSYIKTMYLTFLRSPFKNRTKR